MECIAPRIISSVRWLFFLGGVKHLFLIFLFYFYFTRIRQYPLYSKTEPPASLVKHFEPGVFEKSQNYGKDKAKFALFSGIFKQLLDSFMLQFGFYAWSWGVSQNIMTKTGYGQGYEVIVKKKPNIQTGAHFRTPANRYLSLSCLFSSCSSFRLSRQSLCKSMEPLYLKKNTVSTRLPPCSSSPISSRDGL